MRCVSSAERNGTAEIPPNPYLYQEYTGMLLNLGLKKKKKPKNPDSSSFGCRRSPYLPLWWGWAPDCCRRTAGQPLRSVSSWWWARMGRALNRFDYIPEADLVQTPDLWMGPLMFLEPLSSCSLSPRIHPTPCWWAFLFFFSLPLSLSLSLSSVVSPHPLPSFLPPSTRLSLLKNLLYPVRPGWSLLTYSWAIAAIRQRHASISRSQPPSTHPPTHLTNPLSRSTCARLVPTWN